jgi:hypothetical protein
MDRGVSPGWLPIGPRQKAPSGWIPSKLIEVGPDGNLSGQRQSDAESDVLIMIGCWNRQRPPMLNLVREGLSEARVCLTHLHSSTKMVHLDFSFWRGEISVNHTDKVTSLCQGSALELRPYKQVGIIVLSIS